MDLQSLPKIKAKSYRRVGRGHGSGRVKTSGRGTKGQKARGKISLKFAGSSLQASWLKRLPLKRGKGKNKSYQKEAVIVNVKYLNGLKANSEVTMASLKKDGIVTSVATRVKILGNGELTVPLVIKVPISKSAAKKIEKVGGKIG